VVSLLLADGVDVAGNPIIIYGAVAAALAGYLVLVSERLQKALGPVGRWLTERQLRRLARSERVNDARITDLSEQLVFVLEQQTIMRRQQQALLNLIRDHERWDASVARQLRAQGLDVEDPPPLWPDPAFWR
jgi:hypothetical protein